MCRLLIWYMIYFDKMFFMLHNPFFEPYNIQLIYFIWIIYVFTANVFIDVQAYYIFFPLRRVRFSWYCGIQMPQHSTYFPASVFFDNVNFCRLVFSAALLFDDIKVKWQSMILNNFPLKLRFLLELMFH